MEGGREGGREGERRERMITEEFFLGLTASKSSSGTDATCNDATYNTHTRARAHTHTHTHTHLEDDNRRVLLGVNSFQVLSGQRRDGAVVKFHLAVGTLD